ncbi:homeodomain superfamily [Diaporthe australafricana]|uniref:Homeodomain superfamily n=1 Tax=Diaporthe australafricana TaxID=127596 RepID=A0ABR3WRC4_9PEZI
MIAMVTPTPHAPFRRDYWDEGRSTDYASSRPRSDADRIALPSIRQAFPELQLQIRPQETSGRTHSSAASPTGPATGVMTPPEYVHSPSSSNKRRRLSIDDEREERASRVPRLYNSPPRPAERPVFRQASPVPAPRPHAEHWATSSSRTSPYVPSYGLPAMRSSPVAMEHVERPEPRPTLPSFPPPMSTERGSAPMPRVRGHSSDDYLQEAPRQIMMHPADPRMETSPMYRQSPYAYGYHHPSRMQSLSMGAIHPLDRTPFSAVGYGPHYQEYMRFGELGMGMSGDNKQRKRRGNLPKETTDKLRNWFVGHLHHPYPTEDEKQELMRQTGLQMNQISNWFINARRRQLPAMINNARAESDAMSSGRSQDGKVLPSTERGDYDVDGKHRNSPTISDGGDSAYDDDLDARRQPSHLKRGGSY